MCHIPALMKAEFVLLMPGHNNITHILINTISGIV